MLIALNAPGLGRPPFDQHSFRQAQTLATIELFFKDGIDLSRPKTNYVGEPGVLVLELPLFQALCALLYGILGEHVWIVRSLNLVFTLGNGVLTFLLARRLFGEPAGLISAGLYLFAPLNLVYMSSTLIEPSAIFFALGAFYLCGKVLCPEKEGAPIDNRNWMLFGVVCTITALIKAVYLFPTCVLLAAHVLEQRRLTGRAVKIGAAMCAAGVLFLVWQHHAKEINDQSPFTQGVNPIYHLSLLGASQLVSLQFYRTMGKLLLVELAGPAGGMLALLGWGLVLLGRASGEWTKAKGIMLVFLTSICFYWLAFAYIVYSHDYYNLAMSPFVCIPAGFACERIGARLFAADTNIPARGGLALAIGVAVLSVALFLRRGGTPAAPVLTEFQQLTQSRFERWSFGMIFVGEDRFFGGKPVGDSPSILYAAGLRGTGRGVKNETQAVDLWNVLRPQYQHLKYVVFYGLEPPESIVKACREVVIRDEARGLFAYHVD